MDTATRTDPLDNAEPVEVRLPDGGSWFRIVDKATGRIWGSGKTCEDAWAFARREVRREREKHGKTL